MSKTIHVAICDYCSTIRYGIQHILNRDANISLVAEASSPKEILTKFTSLDLDVILIDPGENRQTGFDCLRKFRELKPNTKTILFTSSYSDKNLIVEAIQTGVQGYLLKQAESEEIINAIYAVDQGDTILAPSVTTILLEYMQHKQHQLQANLSNREQEVLDQIAQGKTNGDIANALFISIRTVKFHVSSILAKLNLKNRTEAALWGNKSPC